MIQSIRATVVALALSTAAASGAQQRPLIIVDGVVQQVPEPPEQDFARYLFPPELIMQFQQKINLRPDQRTAITTAIQQLQSRVLELQWQMQTEVQRLTDIVQSATIKEADALAQVDRVLGIEREVKRTHLGTLIRIKNLLDRDQQTALDSLQQVWRGKAPTTSNVLKRP